MWSAFARLFRRDVADLLPRAVGPTSVERRSFGELAVPSRCLLIADPQYVGSALRIEPAESDRCPIEAEVLVGPSGRFDVAAVTVRFADSASGESEPFGCLSIDSAKALLVDASDFERHWNETGPDRIGVISTARDHRVRKRLEKRFGLKTKQVNDVRAETVAPVSAELEAAITRDLESDPEYAAFPFIHFRVETNNSFDRAVGASGPGFIPVGNSPEPTMFAVRTGYGDGSYPVSVRRAGDGIAAAEIRFIDPESGEMVQAIPDEIGFPAQ